MSRLVRNAALVRLPGKGQARGFAGAAEGAEVDVRGEVLLAGADEGIVADGVPVVRARGPLQTMRPVQLRSGVAVIDHDSVAPAQAARRGGEPGGGGGSDLEAVALAERDAVLVQHRFRIGCGRGRREFAFRLGKADPVPDDPALPRPPAAPDEAVDADGVGDLVGQDDAGNRLWIGARGDRLPAHDIAQTLPRPWPLALPASGAGSARRAGMRARRGTPALPATARR